MTPTCYAQHPHFTAHRLPPVLAGEAVGFNACRADRRTTADVPSHSSDQRRNPSAFAFHKRGAHVPDGPRCVPRSGSESRNDACRLILDSRLGERLVGPVAKAGQIPGEHIVLRLALDYPLRGQQAQTTRLREAGDQATASGSNSSVPGPDPTGPSCRVTRSSAR